MKKVIITLSLIGSGLIILDSFHVYDILAAFIIAGVVPGTDIVIAPQQMLDLFAAAFGFMVSRLAISWIRSRLPENAQKLFSI